MAIIRVEILVAEEDYKYGLSEWENFSAEKKLEILKDVNDTEVSFVWRELWLADEDLNDYADWDIHSLMNRSVCVIGEEPIGKMVQVIE